MNNSGIKRQENNPPHPDSENATIMRETQEDTKFRRSQASKHNLQNTEYHESVLTRLHSPEFQAKGGVAHAKHFKENPDIVKKAATTKWGHKLEQLKQLLGGDPKRVLEELHLKQGLSQKDIAHRYQKHTNTVSRWFKRLGIVTIPYKPRKTGGSINSEVRELVLGAIKKGTFEKLPQRAKDLLTLRYLQIGTPLTLDEIAKRMGGISRQRVSELEKTTLHYLQVNETPEEARLKHIQNMKNKMKNPEYLKRVLSRLHSPEAIERSRLTRLKLYKENPDISKRKAETYREHKVEQLKQLLGGDPKEILEDLYNKQGLSMTDLANRFHTSTASVSLWFKRFGVRPLPQLVRQHIRKQKAGN